MRVAGQPAGRLTRARHRMIGAVIAPLPIAATCTLIVIGFADGWRLALLTALVAAAVAATHLRSSARTALGLVMAVALLAIAGWGPGFDRRSPVTPLHPGRARAGAGARAGAHAHGRVAKG